MFSLPHGEQSTSDQYAYKLKKQLQFPYEMAHVSLEEECSRKSKPYQLPRCINQPQPLRLGLRDRDFITVDTQHTSAGGIPVEGRTVDST